MAFKSVMSFKTKSLTKSLSQISTIPTRIKLIYLLFGIILVVLISLSAYYWDEVKTFSIQTGNMLVHHINPKWMTMYKMDRPFLNIYDQNDRMLNIVFITHHFTRDDCIENYNKGIRNGVKFIGMSSYCEFPGHISNPHDILYDPKNNAYNYNYFELTRGWCHCFRDPYKYITNRNIPIELISESDFANLEKHKPVSDNTPKQYDFIYVCLKDNDKCEDGWQAYNRNWTKAKEWLDIMCKEYKLKGLLVGRINCEIPASCHSITELTDFMEYDKFIENYKKVRFVFVPNISDASPRVMTEGICYNLPVLCNEAILGGWKYVTDDVGEQFNDGNFKEKLEKFMGRLEKGEYRPREYYEANYGVKNSGPKLLEFVKKCIPVSEWNLDVNSITYLKPGIYII